MSFDVNAIDQTRSVRLVPERAPVRGADAGAAARPDAVNQPDAMVDTMPASPPPEVRDQVLAAQKAIQEMYDRGRTLHFSMDSGRVKILLQDLDGNVIREVPSSKVVDIATGRVDD
jgi:flagellar protein FlaG